MNKNKLTKEPAPTPILKKLSMLLAYPNFLSLSIYQTRRPGGIGVSLHSKRGSGMVEILVAIFIFTLILGSLINASNMYLSTAMQSLESTKGAYLAEEGIEAIKIIRDNSWNNISSLSNDTDYYLYFDTSSSTNNIWTSTTTPHYIDSIYQRYFRLSSVYRDSSGRIVTSGGAIDQNTKLTTISIVFTSKNSTTTKTLSTYITNIH